MGEKESGRDARKKEKHKTERDRRRRQRENRHVVKRTPSAL